MKLISRSLILFLILSSVALVWSSAFAWPPEIGKPYPSIKLLDHEGKNFSLESLKGKIVLIEPVGMNCPACNAFAGAHTYGGFNSLNPQKDLSAIETQLPQYSSGIELSDSRLEFVVILLYNFTMGKPSPTDAAQWRTHFKLDRFPNWHVLVPAEDLRGPASYNLIPGFQLLDRELILKSDSTGHHPRNNLWEHTLPMLGTLLNKTGSQVGFQIPPFSLEDHQGNLKSVQEFLGKNPLLMFVYSGCCGHCSQQLEGLSKMVTGLQQRSVDLLGIEYLGEKNSCHQNMAKYNLSGNILADKGGKLCNQLGVGDFTVFLLNRQGKILYRGGLPKLDQVDSLVNAK